MKSNTKNKKEDKERYIKIKEQIDLKNQNKLKRMSSSNSVEMVLSSKNNELSEKIHELKDFELNSLEYEEALLLDKRSYFKYYISLLKNNHPLTFSFLPSNDYNSRIIKIFLFFFSLSLDFTINTLFFNDDTMHKIYEDKGKYNILYQIPQILYSTIISRFIDGLIRALSLTQDNIVELKREKEKKDLDIKYKKLVQTLKSKFISFFIICFIILLFFWYYEICFCGIYVNTQIHLIKDSFISTAIGLLYPFIMYLIPGIFRISALRAEKQDRKYLYKISSFIENFFG